MANPIPTMIPVFKSELLFFACFLVYFWFTKLSHKSIPITPKIIPKKTFPILVNSKLSGISSKQTIATISPAANSKIKLKNRFDFILNLAPNIPPKVVPNVPKNRPNKVVFKISLIFLSSYLSFICILK